MAPSLGRALEHNSGMMESGAFSSPVLATVAGKKQIAVGTRTSLAGLDAASGSVLWSQDVPNYRGMNILTPIVVGDQVFTSLYREDSFLFSIKDHGGKMESKEVWKNKAKGYMSTPVVIAYTYI